MQAVAKVLQVDADAGCYFLDTVHSSEVMSYLFIIGYLLAPRARRAQDVSQSYAPGEHCRADRPQLPLSPVPGLMFLYQEQKHPELNEPCPTCDHPPCDEL